MQLITRAKETQELWEMLVPHIEPPTLRDCAVWCQRFDVAAIQRAFMRIGRKFPSGASLGPDGLGAYRYATSVMVNVEREQLAARGTAVATEDDRGNRI